MWMATLILSLVDCANAYKILYVEEASPHIHWISLGVASSIYWHTWNPSCHRARHWQSATSSTSARVRPSTSLIRHNSGCASTGRTSSRYYRSTTCARVLSGENCVGRRLRLQLVFRFVHATTLLVHATTLHMWHHRMANYRLKHIIAAALIRAVFKARKRGRRVRRHMATIRGVVQEYGHPFEHHRWLVQRWLHLGIFHQFGYP